MKKSAFKFTSSLLVLSILAGCSAPSDDASGAEAISTGTLHAALTLAEGAAHDVAQAHYVVVPADGDCTDVPIAQTTGLIEEESLQGNLDPTGTDVGRAFVDGLMVLPPGDYKVCVQPLQADGTPSEECELVSDDVTVTSEVTTEVTLLSQCQGIPNGALDVVVGLNDPPLITDLNIGPSKFITTCQTASLEVVASDPNGDELSYAWAVVSVPAGSSTAALTANGATASFTPDVAGDYELQVTAFEVTGGGSAKLSFPIHVAEADGACTSAACPDGTYDAAGYCWVVAQPGENGEVSCGRYELTGPRSFVPDVQLTPELLETVSAAVGCTNVGVQSCCATGIFFDAAAGECFAKNFSSTTGNPLQNSPQPGALHLCERPAQ